MDIVTRERAIVLLESFFDSVKDGTYFCNVITPQDEALRLRRRCLDTIQQRFATVKTCYIFNHTWISFKHSVGF